MTIAEGSQPKSKLLLLCNGSERQGTARLFGELRDRWVSQGHGVELVLRDLPRGVGAKLKALAMAEPRNFRRLREADVLVVHTALSISLMSIVLARLLRRPVVAFVWDIYPDFSALAGNVRRPLALSLYRATERLSLRLATKVLIPSDDYRAHLPKRAKNLTVYPLWPTGLDLDNNVPLREWGSEQISLGFAGQINGIRGLVPTMERLLRALPADRSLVLNLLSADPLPEELRLLEMREPKLSVLHHGYVEPSQLHTIFNTLHFGLVSIDDDFALPAFPSKVMAYLAAGLPVLYVGPRMRALEATLRVGGIGLVFTNGGWDDESVQAFFDEYPISRERFLTELDATWGRVDSVL